MVMLYKKSLFSEEWGFTLNVKPSWHLCGREYMPCAGSRPSKRNSVISIRYSRHHNMLLVRLLCCWPLTLISNSDFRMIYIRTIYIRILYAVLLYAKLSTVLYCMLYLNRAIANNISTHSTTFLSHRTLCTFLSLHPGHHSQPI